MLPILTPEEVRAVDADAPEPVEELISRAGAAVARHAVDMLGGTYGKRVVVIAGKGNNGADGREAARLLRRRGVRCEVVAAGQPLRPGHGADLVIDAAYGTGFRGGWEPPAVGALPVLAVDLPSGLDATTGEARGRVLTATRTVTFASLKPGHLLADGPARCGELAIADIGLDAGRARAWLVQPRDVQLPPLDPASHKWQRATWVIAGSPGMTGAATLAARGAQRAGASYVRLSVPGGVPGEGAPVEAVTTELPASRWAATVLEQASRFRSIVIGPGLGRGSDEDLRRVVAESPVPVVVDADGLTALGRDAGRLAGSRTVLTPHDGEFERLLGHKPGADRFAEARALAAEAGCIVLLKGPCTIVAEPGGRTLASTTGDSRLATAGTGDVLAGVIGAFVAQGLQPLEAAAFAAHVHGLAARAGWRRGLVAGDLPDLLPAVLSSLESEE